MIDLNCVAELCHTIAKQRGQIGEKVSHRETADGIGREFTEFINASETDRSVHLPEFTEAQEELADILITCLTELSRRKVNIEDIIIKKACFNRTRDI